jgi:hypothetical protein
MGEFPFRVSFWSYHKKGDSPSFTSFFYWSFTFLIFDYLREPRLAGRASKFFKKRGNGLAPIDSEKILR